MPTLLPYLIACRQTPRLLASASSASWASVGHVWASTALWDGFRAAWATSTSCSRSLAGSKGVIALLLGLLSPVRLDRQFVLHSLESLFDNLLLAVRTLDRLISGKALMGQIRLEVPDRRLGLLEQMFRMFSCLDLLGAEPVSLRRACSCREPHPDPGGS